MGSCSNLTDAQARRLGIRYKTEKGNAFAHTLNNTVVAPPRMLIALLENHLNEDGSVNIPPVLQKYMAARRRSCPRSKSIGFFRAAPLRFGQVRHKTIGASASREAPLPL